MKCSSPWMENPNWKDNKIEARDASHLKIHWIMAIGWNFTCWILLFNLISKINADTELPSLVLIILFTAIGIFLLAIAIQKTKSWFRFGSAPLTLSPFPGSVGGEVGGTIMLIPPLQRDTEFSVTLSNLKHSNSQNNFPDNITWQDTQKVLSQTNNFDTTVPFLFQVPEECQPCGSKKHPGYHYWNIRIEAVDSTINFIRDYDVPIYRLAEPQYSDISVKPLETKLSQAEYVDYQPDEHGLNMNYPMFRNLGFNLAISVIGTIFVLISIHLFSNETAANAWIVGGIFMLLGSLTALTGYYRLGLAYQISVTMEGIYREKQWFFWTLETFFPVGKIKKIQKKQWLGRGGRLFYDIAIVTADNKQFIIGDNIPSSNEADRLIAQIEAALNGATLENYSE